MSKDKQVTGFNKEYWDKKYQLELELVAVQLANDSESISYSWATEDKWTYELCSFIGKLVDTYLYDWETSAKDRNHAVDLKETILKLYRQAAFLNDGDTFLANTIEDASIKLKAITKMADLGLEPSESDIKSVREKYRISTPAIKEDRQDQNAGFNAEYWNEKAEARLALFNSSGTFVDPPHYVCAKRLQSLIGRLVIAYHRDWESFPADREHASACMDMAQELYDNLIIVSSGQMLSDHKKILDDHVVPRAARALEIITKIADLGLETSEDQIKSVRKDYKIITPVTREDRPAKWSESIANSPASNQIE